MKLNNSFDFTILLIGMCIAVLLLATSCKTNNAPIVPARDYQIELSNDSITVYDGERKVGSAKWSNTPTQLDSLLLNDNL